MSGSKKEKLRSVQNTVKYLFVACFILALLSVITVPGQRMASVRAYQRACYSNMKTLASAIERYEVKHNTKKIQITEELWGKLIEEGFIRTRFDDPGMGGNTHRNYITVNDELFCLKHGAIRGREHTAYAELKDLGVTDKELLSRATKGRPRPSLLTALINPFLSLLILCSFFFVVNVIRFIYLKTKATYTYIKTGEES